ncbi:2-iminobutanoate/2-iminopropanoate deaminase isoform X1 [Zootermopsis nevadensis]|uniref:Ribonuclease UK114 n=1 Tax=Zootermopsis nevadensis TaxID=136037 RepID=A0A067QY57_ZOONE|nr:2-iminobutanoate/2-iminopropanoate deaminase isoform X1 [Zootermopsis nevadensis]KDR11138.1 Ribonuclease UK114 [Zootermopsis nevadensis]
MLKSVVRRIVSTDLAPKPVAPYNQAVVIDNTVYLSGVIGLDPSTNKLVDGDTVAQAKQAFINLKHILEAANSSYGNVVKTTVLFADINDFATVNDLYKQYFKEPYPARTAYQVAKLPLDAKIEIEAIAVVGEMVD